MFGGTRSPAACLIAASLLCGVACTVKATKLATGKGYSQETEWRSGDALVIRGINGTIDVRESSGDQVLAQFSPFVLIADDATAREVRHELDKLRGTIEVDESTRTITVETQREGQVLSSLGADVIVSIPEQFDGPLSIHQENGPVEVKGTGHASRFALVNENGSCDLNVGLATVIHVKCGFGDLTGAVPEVPESLETATFETGRGDIELRFPDDEVFSVRALSATGGLVDVTHAEQAGCSVLVASESSKTVVCNGATQNDPVYDVAADRAPEAAFTHDVVLLFGDPSGD